jgi:hypothetical protein
MKKLLYLFIWATLLICCTSNDDAAAYLAPIIGIWRLTSLTFDGKESDTITAFEKRSTATYQEKNWNRQLLF